MWMSVMAWLRGNREAVLLLAAGLLVLALVRGAERRVDQKWQGAQAVATVAATSRKAVIETAAGQAGARVEEATNAELEDLRVRYDALRRRLRADSGRGASRADLPGAAAAAGQPDGAACADVALLTAALLNASEEGDRYRAQLMGWQAWWPQVEAAWALGDKVEAKPPG
jgi:hypothetical protein